MEDIKIIDDLVPRRRRNPPPEANSTKDGDLGVHPPADYYDDIFAKLLGLVGELLGRAAVAAIKWLWIAMDWLGSWIMGAWWVRLKWLSMVLIGAVLLACVVVSANGFLRPGRRNLTVASSTPRSCALKPVCVKPSWAIWAM